MAAVVVFFLSWVALPSVPSEEEISKLLARQKQAFEDDQKMARDPGHNAFIDPQLSPFWGRKSIEYKAQSKAADVVMALRAFGFLGGDDEHKSIAILRRKRDVDLNKAVEDFSAFLPVLRSALLRPAFILPSSEFPHFESQGSNYIALRSIAQALSAYAEVQLADGKGPAALDASLDILALSKLAVGQRAHPLIMTMISSAIQSTGQETLGYVLQGWSDWSEGDLRKALAALKSSSVSAQLGVECLDYELWAAQNTFSRKPDPQSGALVRLPGVWQREWRLYQNDYYPYLEAARARRPQFSGNMTQYTTSSWFLGQHSWMSQLMMPNFERVVSLLEVSHQRQDFLHLYTELLLQKRQGRLPKELSPQWLGRLDPVHISYRVEKGEPHLEYDLESGLAQALPKARGVKRNGGARWENLMHAHWVLPVAP